MACVHHVFSFKSNCTLNSQILLNKNVSVNVLVTFTQVYTKHMEALSMQVLFYFKLD